MVEYEPSKFEVRVRFPAPAQMKKSPYGDFFICAGAYGRIAYVG